MPDCSACGGLNGQHWHRCPDRPPTTPASGLRNTLTTWLRTHALADPEDETVIDSLTNTVTTATNPTPTTNGNHQ